MTARRGDGRCRRRERRRGLSARRRDLQGYERLMADMAAKKTVTVEQIASANRRPEIQTQTLIGLGLNKLHRRRTLEDTPAVRGMINTHPPSRPHRRRGDSAGGFAVRLLRSATAHAAQRDQRQRRLAQDARPHRPRHRLRRRQDGRSRRQGPDGALRRRHRRLRRRPDAAASPSAEARLQQVPPQGLQRDQRRRAAEGDRRQAARRRPSRSTSPRSSPPASLRRPKDGLRLLGTGELKAKLDAHGQPRDGVRQGGDREGRRLDQADREEGSRGRRSQAQEDGRQEGRQSAKKTAERSE